MTDKSYDFREIEARMQDFWAQNEIYRFRGDGREIYSIDTPPPTVSGSLHIGHIFSYTQAEMIARFRRMQGADVFYPFGFDDNGLPTERLVEREEGILARELPPEEFTRKCEQTAQRYEEEFMALWKSLGFSVDWSLQYNTVSPRTQRISQRLFLELMEKGKAYVRQSPVLWCAECRTSIAQAELDTKGTDTCFVTIPFLVDGKPVPVATTRPELLYGCVCLFVHPEDERYRDIVGKSARVPLYGFEIPVLTDNKVDREKGTGAVMCATFGDTADAEWAEQYSLPYKKVILPDGRLEESVPYLGGLGVKKARGEIIRLLTEKGLLLRSEPLSHTVAVHERCGREVEIIPSRQWYINILSEKERFLRAADAIRWYPQSMKSRYTAWVEGLKWDWCVSRQRYFGVPIPVWYCKRCGRVMPAQEHQLPVNPRDSLPESACPCGSRDFIPETAVLDTWATSSVTPLINAKYGEKDQRAQRLLPMSMRTQAHEIIRTWAFYTIVRSLYHTGQIPWKEIMICGFVLAKKGEKISKSKGNAALSPQALIIKHSADVLRYWAAGARLGTDTFFSEEELGLARRFLVKLWNAAQFCLSRLEDYRPGDAPALLPADRWILARLSQVTQKAAQLLSEYEIGLARHEIDEFFWSDYCDHYLELAKDRLYNPEARGREASAAAQYTLYRSLLGILQLYAVYVPHITEHLYQTCFRRYEVSVSLHLTVWNRERAEDDRIIAFGDALKQCLFKARKYRSENGLSRNTPVESVTVRAGKNLLPLFRESEQDLTACTRAEKIIYLSGD